MTVSAPKYSPGLIVVHEKFEYRGVIIDVDAEFSGSNEWYEHVARSRPPKDKPWYHVLVHGSNQQTYVAERHLAVDSSGEAIRHPMLDRFFDTLSDGVYLRSRLLN